MASKKRSVKKTNVEVQTPAISSLNILALVPKMLPALLPLAKQIAKEMMTEIQKQEKSQARPKRKKCQTKKN